MLLLRMAVSLRLSMLRCWAILLDVLCFSDSGDELADDVLDPDEVDDDDDAFGDPSDSGGLMGAPSRDVGDRSKTCVFSSLVMLAGSGLLLFLFMIVVLLLLLVFELRGLRVRFAPTVRLVVVETMLLLLLMRRTALIASDGVTGTGATLAIGDEVAAGTVLLVLLLWLL